MFEQFYKSRGDSASAAEWNELLHTIESSFKTRMPNAIVDSTGVHQRKTSKTANARVFAKAQAAGTGSTDVLSVKFCNSAGTESGAAFNAYVQSDKSSVDLDAYWPMISEDEIIKIEKINNVWFLADPIVNHTDKWAV